MLDFGVKIISSPSWPRYVIVNDDDWYWDGQHWTGGVEQAEFYADFDLATNVCLELWLREELREEEGNN